VSAAGHRVRRAVALGGGHGLSRTLAALRLIADEVVAVVSVADDGGSSGRLRRDLDVIPPGDLRMALTALSQRARLAEVLGYRFPRGELEGHALGNLVLVALQDLHSGDLVAALDELALHLGVAGRVLPCTSEAVTLQARSAAGGVSGQAAIAATTRLERVWLEPAAPAGTPAALEAVAAADLVVLGPGSLYTSLLPNLLVPDLAAAVAAARAPRVLVANLREQPGETEGMTLLAHLEALREHVPALTIDAMVVHDGPAPRGPGRSLRDDPLGLEGRVATVVRADLLDEHDGHDPVALADAFAQLV
jgi:uncharacterized cofD-like protein